jgi:hypothetical protein
LEKNRGYILTMGLFTRGIPLIPFILSLSFCVSVGHVKMDPPEKDIKSLFFNPNVPSEEIRKVVVLPIRPGEGLESARRISGLLLARLSELKKYDITPAQNLKDLVEKKGMDWGTIHHYTHVLEIGKSLGVDGVMMGSLSDYGWMADRTQFGLNLRMIRIPEGDTAWSMSSSARGNPKEMEEIAKKGIDSILWTLVHRWQSEKATTAWGIKLQPLKALGGNHYITVKVPKYGDTEIREYIVSRGTSEPGPYTVIKRLRQKRRAIQSFKDRDVQAGLDYFYRYQVLTNNGFLSLFSEAVRARLVSARATSGPPKP